MAKIKKIAIYGNKGMLGHDLFEELMTEYEVVGFDIDNGDITNREGVLKAIGQYMPDVVINCAAYTDVDGCESNAQKAFSVNADGCLFIAQACKEHNVKLIFISTDYVFNGKKDTPYAEDDTPEPLSIYGKSKFKGEKYLERTTSDFICIRTSGLYGLRGRSFIKSILTKAKTESVLRVVNDQKCCPTYTRDLAKIIKELLKTDYKGFLNVVNPEGCSWYDFTKEILKAAGIKNIRLESITSEELGLPAKRPANSVLSIDRLENELKIKIRSRKEALPNFLEELKNSSDIL